MLLVPNGSPYELDKDDLRQRLVRSRASSSTGLPLVYLNRVGGQDELVFDGSSFVMHRATATWSCRCATGTRQLLITDWAADGRRLALHDPREPSSSIPIPEDIYRAMMVGLARLCQPQRLPGRDPRPVGRDRQRACRRRSRSMRSAPDKVWGVMMPSKYTSHDSLEDARENARGCSAAAMTSSRSRPAVDALDEMLARASPAAPGLPRRISRRGCGW